MWLLKKKRVLDLSNSCITTLPKSIDKLILLRYLNVSGCRLNKLPESLCDLHNLQTLKLPGNQDLNVLPSHMSRLINLRYLEVPEILSGIERLKNLQELPEFTILRVENESSSNITELRDINQLRGRLCMNNLKFVQSEEDARNATRSNRMCWCRIGIGRGTARRECLTSEEGKTPPFTFLSGGRDITWCWIHRIIATTRLR